MRARCMAGGQKGRAEAERRKSEKHFETALADGDAFLTADIALLPVSSREQGG